MSSLNNSCLMQKFRVLLNGKKKTWTGWETILTFIKSSFFVEIFSKPLLQNYYYALSRTESLAAASVATVVGCRTATEGSQRQNSPMVSFIGFCRGKLAASSLSELREGMLGAISPNVAKVAEHLMMADGSILLHSPFSAGWQIARLQNSMYGFIGFNFMLERLPVNWAYRLSWQHIETFVWWWWCVMSEELEQLRPSYLKSRHRNIVCECSAIKIF